MKYQKPQLFSARAIYGASGQNCKNGSGVVGKKCKTGFSPGKTKKGKDKYYGDEVY